MSSTPIDREKLLSLSVGRSRTDRRGTAKEWRSEDGERHKAVTDELGNTVVQHAQPNNTEDRQDVRIRASHVRAVVAQTEVRSGTG